MREAGVSKTAFWRWQERFAQEGLDGLLRDKTRPARIPSLGPEVAARAWWALAGGRGEPRVNCTLIDELLDCYLAPAPCALSRDLGVELPISSQYAGVFVSSPSRTQLSSGAHFASLFLRRALKASCDELGAPAPCEPSVALHDAYSTALGTDESGAWVVVDPTQPLWAESNWPALMYATLWPFGHSPLEGGAMLALGLLNMALTYALVCYARYQYETAYKRL